MTRTRKPYVQIITTLLKCKSKSHGSKTLHITFYNFNLFLYNRIINLSFSTVKKNLTEKICLIIIFIIKL